jgi:hypothetical protein
MLHMSMPSTLKARSYWIMHVFDNHICVSSAKCQKHLTFDNGVVTTFDHDCRSMPNVQWPILAKLEYVGWVEEILELNYGILKIVVLLM